jgi:hypothetical protein
MAGILRRHWGALLAAGLAIFVPIGLLETIDADLQAKASDAEGALAGIEVAGIALLHTAGALLGGIIFAGLISALAEAERRNDAPGLLELSRELPFGRLVLADLSFVLAVTVGLLLFVVPGFLFMIWFSLAGPALEVEHLGVRGAFRRSRELVRSRFWLVTGFVIPLPLAEGALGEAIHEASIWSIGANFAAEWVSGTIATLVTSTLLGLAVTVLYLELTGAEASPRTPPAESRPPRRVSPA